MTTIDAAGTVPWRRRKGALEVALVHRPKYDDWAWTKGKLDAGEDWPAAAARETFEETGLQVRLGIPLPAAAYPILDRKGNPATKRVRYWAAEVTGGNGALLHEIDAVAWLDVPSATKRLAYDHDRDQLQALANADSAGTLQTWPLLIVRHAEALARSAWKGRPDPDRPLSEAGWARSEALPALFAAYGVERLLSSPSMRCVQSVEPYAAAAGLRVHTRTRFSEEGFLEVGARPLIKHLRRLLDAGVPTLVCTHGPVLPTILGHLEREVDPAADPAVARELAVAAAKGMGKGEVLVAHVTSTGPEPRIVAVERHDP